MRCQAGYRGRAATCRGPAPEDAAENRIIPMYGNLPGCEDPAVRASVAAHAGHPLASPVDVFAHLRNWKDGFRG